MNKLHIIIAIVFTFFLSGCYNVERKCEDFKTGKFISEYEFEGKIQKTKFTRNDSIEISTFNNKIDSASVRWINDCEYILKKINPKNRAERKAVHIKILTTSLTGYTFEFSLVGNSQKKKGSVTKIK